MIKNNIIKMNRMTVQLLMIMGLLILNVNQVRAVGEVSGITLINDDAVEFHLDSNDWADVHYKVNGGNQRNIRMTLSKNGNRFQLNNLSSGDSVNYRFTYWGSEGFAIVTSVQNYTLQSEQAKDTDNDGVVDSIDQCSATRQGTTVNDVGCELDSDNDGVVDSLDQCPNTQSGQAVDTNGCELATEMTGIEQVGSDTVHFYVNNNAWADVHFKVNGGGQ
ncbi:thrombospondin type 3 repeat-containing protein [Moritella viscosa]